MTESPVAFTHENGGKSWSSASLDPGRRVGRGLHTEIGAGFFRLARGGILALGSGCTTLSSKAARGGDEPGYSLIHLSGTITSIPNPKHWPGILRVGRPVDLWITVDNQSKDAAPLNPNRGSYSLDEIPSPGGSGSAEC